MTYAPPDLRAIRAYLIDRLDINKNIHLDTDLEPDEVGIIGDYRHRATGGYHEGRDDLEAVNGVSYDYSTRQQRDRLGLTNAASAMDIGQFNQQIGGVYMHQGILGAKIVQYCTWNDPRAECVREVIYTANGTTVSHYDAIGEQRGADSSHLTHTHISFWRDTENKRDGFLRLLQEILEPERNHSVAVLARRSNEPHVWLCDGITRRWIPNENQLADVRYLGLSGQIPNLFRGGEVQIVADLEAYGVPAPGSALPPESVESRNAEKTL